MGEAVVAVLVMASCVFGASAAAKLRSRAAFRAFRAGLAGTGVMGRAFLPAGAVLLAGAEAVSAALLAVSAVWLWAGAPGATEAAELALAIGAALTSVLAGGVAVVVRRGTAARCACFGAASALPLGRVHLVRNVSLLAVLATGLALATAAARPPVAGAAVAAMAGILVALLFIRWEDLASLVTPLTPAGGGTATAGRSGERRR
ncbi:MAG TPA: MauE/DoxX family redox-associated membrane protein [Streptosporangiaceae bacterium]|nr:MauE/DoxX family redox-associated membrane protein [Streptosporangiaceae bacterium]